LAADAWQSDHEAAWRLHSELHLVLYSQSRHDEADAVYALLATQEAAPRQLLAPLCIQIASLSNRTRYAEAVSLGAGLLETLGLTLPLENTRERLEQELDLFYGHAAAGALERLPAQRNLDDERLLMVAQLLNRLIPAALFSGSLLGFWMMARCSRLWIEAGYCEFLSYPMCCITMVTIALREDHATGYRAARAALETALARDHGGLEVARAQHAFGLFACHWFQPLTDDLGHAQAAFAGLLRAGDLEFANFTFFTSQAALFDTCAQLAEMATETAAAIGFTRKTGSRHSEQAFLSYRQLVRALAGDTRCSGDFADADFGEAAHLAAIQSNAMAQAYFHTYRALGACLFNDAAGLSRHAEAAVGLSRHISGFYPTALAIFLHSLALIGQLRVTGEAARPALLEQLGANQAWLAARAADAPMNFGHLYDLVEAERLDALDQPWEALQTFERAMRRAGAQRRPWHQALITERAGHCYLRRGLEDVGRALLARAHTLYRQWGAEGKARAMRDVWPFLDASHPGSGRGSQGDALDHEAQLRAAQALASERSLPGLVARVVELVGQLTGATDVRLLVLDEAGHWWLEGGVRGGEPLGRMTVDEAAQRGIITATALRLSLKTLAPLVSDDAVIDSRFAGDPHFADLPLCSLLGLPIFVQGRLTALLVLENRLFRAAFSAARIEAVSILCGQLAVSLENARLYQSLEHKVAQRTGELSEANRLLTDAIRRAEMEIAERTRAEQALRESEEKFKAIANYAASWEAWFSPQGKLLWMNRFSLELTGFTPEEYMAADDFLVMSTLEEDRPVMSENFQKALQGSSGDHVEFRCLRKDGSHFWIYVSWRPILDATGRWLGFRTSAQDITASRQAREELARARAAAEAANRELAILSTTDSLTGLANRRRFDETLQAEWQRGARAARPLSLAMLDVDWFKRYNDHYGHQAGDECLRALAGVLGAQAHRISDLAARYGGEEFAVIAPDTDAAGMLRLAESIHTALEALALPHAESPLGRVTVSIGLAVLVPGDAASPAALLRLADEALYRAKAQGRNRTVPGSTPAAGA
jgi:diguanylate cyclase (GGDEF)-like protein/PAS domain S-box-containing protein